MPSTTIPANSSSLRLPGKTWLGFIGKRLLQEVELFTREAARPTICYLNQQFSSKMPLRTLISLSVLRKRIGVVYEARRRGKSQRIRRFLRLRKKSAITADQSRICIAISMNRKILFAAKKSRRLPANTATVSCLNGRISQGRVKKSLRSLSQMKSLPEYVLCMTYLQNGSPLKLCISTYAQPDISAVPMQNPAALVQIQGRSGNRTCIDMAADPRALLRMASVCGTSLS